MRISLLTLTAALVSSPAFAADLGTYRPGTPYHSVIVPTANVCESQCDGDARCRGWNYVKPTQQASGVCEFQSQVGAPISSAISISGVSNAAPMSNRIVSGATNTVRVGTSVTQSQPAQQSMSQSGRRIVRQALPAQPQGFQANLRQPYPAQQPGLNPMLDGAPRQAAPRVVAPAPRGPARFAPQSRRPQGQAPAPYVQTFTPNAYAPTVQGRPPIGQPIQTPTAQSPYMAPRPSTQAQMMPRSSVNNPIGWSAAPQPLYGTLHDDVRGPAVNNGVAPAPNGAVPMTRARPVTPVAQVPLAGAQPRY